MSEVGFGSLVLGGFGGGGWDNCWVSCWCGSFSLIVVFRMHAR